MAVAWFASIATYIIARPHIQIDLLTGVASTTVMVAPSLLICIALFVVMAHNEWKRGLQTLILLPVTVLYGNCQGWLVVWARLHMLTVGLSWNVTRRKTSTDAPAAS